MIGALDLFKYILPGNHSVEVISQKVHEKICYLISAAKFKYLTLLCIMSQNGQTHFKNLATFAARILKCV